MVGSARLSAGLLSSRDLSGFTLTAPTDIVYPQFRGLYVAPSTQDTSEAKADRRRCIDPPDYPKVLAEILSQGIPVFRFADSAHGHVHLGLGRRQHDGLLGGIPTLNGARPMSKTPPLANFRALGHTAHSELDHAWLSPSSSPHGNCCTSLRWSALRYFAMRITFSRSFSCGFAIDLDASSVAYCNYKQSLPNKL